MTEYWKSVGNYYCDYCKCFVRNDDFNRRQHEGSDRHQNSLKRQIRNIHRTTEKEKRDLNYANKELARIGGRTLEQRVSQDQPKKVSIGVKHRPKKASAKPADTLDDSTVYESVLAANALPGDWTVTEEAEPLAIATHEDVKEPAETTPSILRKRCRDGADEELLEYTVQVKAMPVIEPVKLEEGATVTFKKRKPKTKPMKRE